ncbi:MAG TPA: hypothetical protein VGE75_07005 [Acidimicrobiales bacterium]
MATFKPEALETSGTARVPAASTPLGGADRPMNHSQLVRRNPKAVATSWRPLGVPSDTGAVDRSDTVPCAVGVTVVESRTFNPAYEVLGPITHAPRRLPDRGRVAQGIAARWSNARDDRARTRA